MLGRGGRLDEPRRSPTFAASYDPEIFGRVSEGLARSFGSARYLVIQAMLVVAWITLDVVWVAWRWDPYLMIPLNFAFATQVAYAALLLVLAQNRQVERARLEYEQHRIATAEMRAEIDFLAREMADARLALGRIEAALARADATHETEG